ncbi:hypothetical protein B0H15DRAFT_844108 [Mycena belliarum]|uniref:Uncharacterized protein n=1 Tax=Mycena belliarum TaxID=1033014 RepID=A0AAD6U394_9AGAR|nr:hypothetical protein B0H15DRAFT_844108 [Mycena belliae]
MRSEARRPEGPGTIITYYSLANSRCYINWRDDWTPSRLIRLQPSPMATPPLLISVLAALAALVWLRARKKNPIPTIAEADGVLASYRTALCFWGNAADVVRRGCRQFPEGVFRVPTLFRWEYVANGPQLLLEIVAAPESVLSFHEGAADVRG